VPDATLLHLLIHFANPMHEKDEVGAERAVHQEFTAPMAIGTLLPQQVFLRARNRL
jgi:hypothetical protein